RPGSCACLSWDVRSRDTRCVEQVLASIKQYLDSVIPTTSCSTVNILLAVNHNLDRARKVALLLDGLRAQKGAGAIPLLMAVERRSLIAAQTPGVVDC